MSLLSFACCCSFSTNQFGEKKRINYKHPLRCSSEWFFLLCSSFGFAREMFLRSFSNQSGNSLRPLKCFKTSTTNKGEEKKRNQWLHYLSIGQFFFLFINIFFAEHWLRESSRQSQSPKTRQCKQFWAPFERFNNCGENKTLKKNRIESFSIKNALWQRSTKKIA